MRICCGCLHLAFALAGRAFASRSALASLSARRGGSRFLVSAFALSGGTDAVHASSSAGAGFRFRRTGASVGGAFAVHIASALGATAALVLSTFARSFWTHAF